MAMKLFAEMMANKGAKTAFVVLGATLALSACTRSTDLNQGGFFPSARTGQADPLPPAPTARVESGALQPASPTPPPVPSAPSPEPAPEVVKPEPVEVAKVDPEITKQADVTPAPKSDGKTTSVKAMNGTWTVAAGSVNCQAFLTGLKWPGGYRAAPRGCSGSSLGDVGAWNLKGNTVVLVDRNGTQVASLNRVNGNRFDGRTKDGTQVTISR